MKNQKNKIILKGLLRFLMASFFCFVLLIFWVVFHDKSRILNGIVFGICFILIVIMIYADYALKSGGKMRELVKFHGETEDRYLGLKTGLLATVPNYIGLLLLLMSKLEIIGNIPLWIYAFLNVYFYPIMDLFLIPASYETVGEANYLINSTIPGAAFVVMALLPLIVPVSSHIAYVIGYNQIDLKGKILYKKDR